jgi:hypothetical protein
MPREKTRRPLGKRIGRVGKFPTQEEVRIAELRQKAYAREGRNAIMARAILNALDRPLKKRESDRALGRRLSVDHRTIGRWRERIKGQRRKRGIISRRKFLGACQTLAGSNIPVMSQRINPQDIRCFVRPAYEALHRIQNGPRTLPERQRKVPRK